MLNPNEATQLYDSNTSTLQPMRFSELLDTTFSLYRKYFLLFLRIIALHFFGKLVTYSLEGFLSNIPLKSVIASLVSEPFAIVSMGGIIIASAITYLGRHITSRDALRYTLQRFFPMFGGYLLWLLFFIIPFISISRVGGEISSVSLWAMLLTCIPLPTYFLVRWLFVVEAVLLEKLPIGASLKRSSELVRGMWWRVCSISISFFILSGAISIIFKVSVVCILVLTNIAGETGFIDIIRWAIMESTIDSSNLPFYAIMTCTDLVVDTLTFPIWIIGNTLLYFDLWIRKDQSDIEIQINDNRLTEVETDAKSN
ncbi:MAG: hypothetical protein OXH00_13995 [Candidatus Poribacteria bacterium]|nr:hypothetical protein [Candidatus Poribacteria bacterium]